MSPLLIIILGVHSGVHPENIGPSEIEGDYLLAIAGVRSDWRAARYYLMRMECRDVVLASVSILNASPLMSS